LLKQYFLRGELQYLRRVAAARAITTVFPKAYVQTCIVHLMRNSLDFFLARPEGSGGAIEGNLSSTQASEAKLEEFAAGKCGSKYSSIAAIS